MKKFLSSLLIPFLLFLYACSPENDLVSFKVDEHPELSNELEATFTAIKWASPEAPPTQPNTPPLGSLTLPLNFPLYTLRTEGVGTDFQETDAFRPLLYQSLLDYKLTQNTYTPVLAKRWSFSPRSNEPIYFELEPSAQWTDGSPVTANDVVATFKFLSQADLEQGEKTNFFQDVDAIALNKNLVRISMPEMDEGSFYRLVSQSIYPAKELALYTAKDYLELFNNKALMGSGAYVLDEEHSLKEKEITFLHKSDYWGRKLPYQKNIYNFEKITYRIIQDAKAREWSFKEGNLDVLPISSARSWIEDWLTTKEPLLTRGIWQKRKIINAIPHGVSGIAFNLRRPLLADQRLRQVLAHLWNREEVIDSLFLGEYIPTDSFYPSSRYENPKNATYPYDPAKALRILNGMGYHQTNQGSLLRDLHGNTINLELLITPREMAFFHQFSADVKKIGINLKVTVLPNNALQLRLINHDFDMAYTGFRGRLFPRPDLQFISGLANDKNTLNIWGLKDPKIDGLLAEFVDKTPDEQIKIMHDLDAELAKKIIFLYGWHSPYANRLIYWNKFNQPLGLLGEYGNYFAITKLWSTDPHLVDQTNKRNDPSVFLPVGNEVFNYYQDQL